MRPSKEIFVTSSESKSPLQQSPVDVDWGTPIVSLVGAVLKTMRFWGCAIPVFLCHAHGQDDRRSALALTSENQFRLPDDRPKLDREELRACGLHVIESRRLVLVTDVVSSDVKDLPLLADALFEELERQQGTLAPDLAKSDFQVTGYLIDAKERFVKAGVLPPKQFAFRHGKNMGYQFWMNNQATDYYRRHLLLHEFVHCFMMCEHGMNDIPPLWYTEGLAEYFATHQIQETISATRFGILPPAVVGFEGWGRITEIRNILTTEHGETKQREQLLSVEGLLHPADNNFTDDLKYAQAWAIIWLIRNHQELKAEFACFDRVRARKDFLDAEGRIPTKIWKRLTVLWPLYLDSLAEGFDTDRSFPALIPTETPWTDIQNSPLKVSVRSDKSWQSSGVLFTSGQSVTVSCSGRYTVHDQPKPWVSEPQGITIDYHRGRPLGEVTAMVLSPTGAFLPQRVAVGTGREFAFAGDTELWLQINDSAARRAGNSGTAEITIKNR